MYPTQTKKALSDCIDVLGIDEVLNQLLIECKERRDSYKSIDCPSSVTKDWLKLYENRVKVLQSLVLNVEFRG